MAKFTADNYQKGFLMDDELMAGITDAPDASGSFTAFVVRHTTGETLGSQRFFDLFEAIRTMNAIPREWSYEAVSRCGGGNCGSGKCGKEGGGCNKISGQSQSSCETGEC